MAGKVPGGLPAAGVGDWPGLKILGLGMAPNQMCRTHIEFRQMGGRPLRASRRTCLKRCAKSRHTELPCPHYVLMLQV